MRGSADGNFNGNANVPVVVLCFEESEVKMCEEIQLELRVKIK